MRRALAAGRAAATDAPTGYPAREPGTPEGLDIAAGMARRPGAGIARREVPFAGPIPSPRSGRSDFGYGTILARCGVSADAVPEPLLNASDP